MAKVFPVDDIAYLTNKFISEILAKCNEISGVLLVSLIKQSKLLE